MKHVFKTCCAFLLVTVMCLTLFACKGNVNPDITVNPSAKIEPKGDVKFTCSISTLKEEAAADAFIAEFEKKYPDVNVTKDYNPGNIPARIASGEIGDVFYFTEEETYNYAVTQKSLLQLNQYIQPLGVDTSAIYSGIYALGMVEGQLYMVPRDYNHIVMVYNKTALTEAGLAAPEDGWTWEDFKSYCTQLTKTDPADANVYQQVGGYLNYSWDPVYVSFLEGWGGSWVDVENKVITLTDEKVRTGIEELLTFAKTGAIKPEGQSDMSKYSKLTEEAYVFRTMVYPNIVSIGQSYDNLGIDWDFVSFPALPTHKVGTGSAGFGVYKYTENPNAAAALALFFFTVEGQTAYHSAPGGSVPLMKELGNADFWRYTSSKDTEADWSTKNFDAFISFPEADTIGRPNCKMPSRVASVITSGWAGMLGQYFDNGNYIDSLTTMETTANETWQRILNSSK